jgi:hypothetical protein
MLDTAEPIACYESIGHLSRLMLAAAEARDWRLMAEAEHCCAALIDRLRAGGGVFVLDQRGRRRRLEILASVLEDDARIRDLTDPSMRRVDALLRKPPARETGAKKPCCSTDGAVPARATINRRKGVSSAPVHERRRH